MATKFPNVDAAGAKRNSGNAGNSGNIFISIARPNPQIPVSATVKEPGFPDLDPRSKSLTLVEPMKKAAIKLDPENQQKSKAIDSEAQTLAAKKGREASGVKAFSGSPDRPQVKTALEELSDGDDNRANKAEENMWTQ
jgi:hypothetical protein